MRPLLFLIFVGSLAAQMPDMADPNAMHHDHAGMAKLDMAGMAGHNHGDPDDPGEVLMRQVSGTSMNPQSWKMPMVAAKTGSWNWMFMGQGFLVDTQQSGPRGADKLYSSNWAMAMAERAVGKGAISIEWMGSLEPLTVTDRRYPLLFQTGETAFGKPLTWMHNTLTTYSWRWRHSLRPPDRREDTMFQLYFAPVGDPARWVQWHSRTAHQPPSFRRRLSAIIGRTPATSPMK